MGDKKNVITLKEYIQKLGTDGRFIIPEYQRGYVWGQHNDLQKEDSVTHLLNSIKTGYDSQKDIFLQGITCHRNNNDITLVDGQQRTTFFYLLLKFLRYEEYISIWYKVRKESNDFLAQLDINKDELKEDEEFQDIYFFKYTLSVFHKQLNHIEKKNILEYVLEHIHFLYIEIPEEKASLVFSMMNGSKAIMRQEELIKSELLRCCSLNNNIIQDAENNAIRNRLAREWDKWLYWWKKEEVSSFFHIDKQLGWLLPLMIKKADISFDSFKDKCLKSLHVKDAKALFRNMRLLQKRIEDAYNDPLCYNYIGAILNIRRKDEHYQFMNWYFNDITAEKDSAEAREELRRYFDWAFLSISHQGILEKDENSFNEAKRHFQDALFDNDLYVSPNKEIGFRWLLRCNILEDCSQSRKFNFNIWNQRSLEHIYPKSKVGHKQEGNSYNGNNEILENDDSITLWREDIIDKDDMNKRASEHSIGNLVLLYGADNSAFNNSEFEQKKNIFFNIRDEFGFQSRHLLHTISVFANSQWGAQEIVEHKYREIERFINEYNRYE